MQGSAVFLALCLGLLLVPVHARPTRRLRLRRLDRASKQAKLRVNVEENKIFTGNLQDGGDNDLGNEDFCCSQPDSKEQQKWAGNDLGWNGGEQDEEERFSGSMKKAARFQALPGSEFYVKNLTQIMWYLRDFGWLESDFWSVSNMRRAITNFQKFANIPVTGKLDHKTTEMMWQPRCGVPDTEKKLESYTIGGRKWRKNEITYRILNYYPDLSRVDIRREIRSALEMWAEHTPLHFRRLTGGARPDIEISFLSFSHGDGHSFDGPGKILAHAYGPGGGIGGDTHFDGSETWTINRGIQSTIGRPRGVDLHQVAAHQFGHALGLGHSRDRSALMSPFYRLYRPNNFRLHSVDIRGIQRLYGGPTRRATPTLPPQRHPPIAICPPAGQVVDRPRDAVTCSRDAFDGFARVANGSVYAFRGRHFWRLNSVSVDEGYPQLIADVWEGLPENGIDAALYLPFNRKTYFFKGGRYWRFDGASADSGYPRSIRTWRTVPNIDAALYYGEYQGKNRTYFFKGDKYWRYTEGSRRQDRGYPKSISLWRGFPDRLDAAMQWTNDLNYIFLGDQYWRLDKQAAVTNANPAYPRSVAEYWLGCFTSS